MRRLVYLPLGAAAVVVLVIGTLLLAFVAFRQFEAAGDSVEHSTSVKLALRDALQTVLDAETGQRGYVITGRPEFLEPYTQATSEVAADLGRLRELTADDPSQRARLEELERLLRRRLDLLHTGISLREAGGIGAVAPMMDEGKRAMDALRRAVEAMDREEDAFLASRRAHQDRTSALTIGALVLTSAVSSLFVVLGVMWRRASAERERTMQFQERFVAILGHDLRNPLSALLAGITLVRRTGSEAAERHLARMESSARRMARMIDQLLDLTRIRLGGGLPVTPSSIELGKLVEDVTDELRAARPEGIVVVERLGRVEGRWDPDRIGQVVSNLVGNAMDYGTPGEPVRVTVRGEPSRALIRVHNAGPPIAPEVMRRLFDPFRRGERESRERHTRGLGLGLFITREVVAAHGGRVEVESGGEGTTFSITLPRAELAA